MELKVKEILKEKGLRMSDLAERMGINQSNLQKSLSKNPTIATLQDVATALNVQLGELFPASAMMPTAKSIMVMDGKTYGVVSMQNIVSIPHYTYFPKLHDVVTVFVKNSLEHGDSGSICGIVDALEMFCLSFNQHNKVFTLSICYDNEKMLTFFYDVLEYSDAVKANVEQILNDILNDITGAVTQKQQKNTH